MEKLGKETLTLFQLNSLVKGAMQAAMPDSYWVVAEISEINEHSSGHCYLELIQKDELSNILRAKARATIWGATYRMLKPYFESTTGRNLTRGLKILVNVQVAFHEMYGYSLNVVDIEPSYTLGDIELKRRETIQRLTNDGVVEMNRELQFVDLPKRIAIVSSIKAAGLQDFINQLDNNPNGYIFIHRVFPATMQGDSAEASIIESLNSIYADLASFDAVVIVRGGGSQSDLSCFDSYDLALNIAQFPLPIVTGIGHDKDKSVADMVAYASVKTPTAAAEFFINIFADSEGRIIDAVSKLSDVVGGLLSKEQGLIDSYKQSVGISTMGYLQDQHIELTDRAKSIPIAVNRQIASQNKRLYGYERQYLLCSKSYILKRQGQLATKMSKLASVVQSAIGANRAKLEQSQKLTEHLDPMNILKKGYSLTYLNGKLLTRAGKAAIGDALVTKLSDGELQSEVLKKY